MFNKNTYNIYIYMCVCVCVYVYIIYEMIEICIFNVIRIEITHFIRIVIGISNFKMIYPIESIV